MTKQKALAILLRAAVTFVEAALGVIVAAGTTNLNIETAEAAAIAGVAAAGSVLYNAVRAWLDTLQGVDPLPNG
jgi:hypothetical protein